IGLDEGHIGRVIHKYLFESAQFRLIKDEHTDDWRAWKPWQAYDAAHKEKTREAPPLIPERFIKGNKVWRDKGARIFNTVHFQNGWTLMAFGSQSEPAAGFQADLIHIDEDIQDPDWYDEMIARLTMRNGKMRWSALPLARNDALLNVCERAEEERDSDNPSTVVIQATVFDNPFMDAQTRKENIKRWKSKGEDEYRKR
ncbi:MAG: hypothetical protein GY809_04080, partial [Planctomycetes bacterium]|nr:hypothetical protein [Planctomycetota bacterium]